MTPAPGSCLPLLFLCLPISAVRRCGAGSGVVSPACLPVSPSLCGQMPDAVRRWLRGCVSRFSPCVSAVGCQLAVVSPACLPVPVSPSLCGQMPDAGSRVVSPACLPLSPSLCSQMLLLCVPPPACSLSPSLCSQMPDAVTLAAGSCRVSRLSPCVLQGLSGQIPDAVTLAAGSCLALVSLCSPRSDARCCDAGSRSCLPLVSLFLPDAGSGSAVGCQMLGGSGVVPPACLPVSPSLCGWLFV